MPHILGNCVKGVLASCNENRRLTGGGDLAPPPLGDEAALAGETVNGDAE